MAKETHDHGLDPELPILTAKFEQIVKWARQSAIWPAQFGLACCAIEMMAMAASRYDIARFGAEVFRGSPRQSDLMIVAGASRKMAPCAASTTRCPTQVGDPMGACASSADLQHLYHRAGYEVVPVDVYVPGRPQAGAADPRDHLLQEKS
jgi:NADH-quinone oxidoreductase subunit B